MCKCAQFVRRITTCFAATATTTMVVVVGGRGTDNDDGAMKMTTVFV